MDLYSSSAINDLSPERIIDQIRTRIASLRQALSRIQASIDPSNTNPNHHPLPPWQAQALLPAHAAAANKRTHRKDLEAFHAAATSHLAALYDTLADPARKRFLAQAHVYPTTHFPRAAEYMIELLLRKRHHPAVADWLERGVAMGLRLEQPSEGRGDERSVDWEDLWRWAGPASSGVASAVFPEFVSEEEGVAVRKGKEPVGEAAGPMMPIEDVLRFMVSGEGS